MIRIGDRVKIRAIWFASAVIGALVVLASAPAPSLAESALTPSPAPTYAPPTATLPEPGAVPNATPVWPRHGADDSTLEIAPEGRAQAKSQGTPTPGETPEVGALNSGVGLGLNLGAAPSRQPPRPYLGVTVRYTAAPDLGPKRHALEIVSVDPGSPAEKAGLRGATGATAAGAVGRGASEVLGPLKSLTMPLLKKSGSLGASGDLIVAVDSEPIQSPDDLAKKLAQLKPGDRLYLTVVRALGDGGHHTVRVALTLGGAGRYVTAGPSGTPWTY
jgi:PDZ domain